MKKLLVYIFIIYSNPTFCQGRSNLWLVGYQDLLDIYSTSTKATIDFQTGNPVIFPNFSKMRFTDTEGNIADTNGNLLMCSNGIWIADATGDTMMNGSGLNPGLFATNHKKFGAPIPNGNFFLPWPGDSNKYVLFHIIGNNYLISQMATELYYSVIDITLNGGLGAVTLKNQIAFQDTLTWGITACKHANGRDWWIIAIKDNSKTLIITLLTPNGIASVTRQSFPSYIVDAENACQPVFSPDGNKFAFTTGFTQGGNIFTTSINYFDFDRCTGIFSNHQKLSINDGKVGYAACFSPNSKYLYAATTHHIYQINTDSLPLIVDTIAEYDGYVFPGSGTPTSFWLMYLARNNRIYVSSGTGVLDLNQIIYPDSGGTVCTIQQHSLHLPCWNDRTVPNHPNYFLGPVIGSICDSLQVGIAELNSNNNTIKIYPNPANDFFWLDYDISTALNTSFSPATGNGKLIIYNTLGEVVLQKTIYNYFKTVKVDCSNLPAGIYYILVEQNNQKTGSGKVIKQ